MKKKKATETENYLMSVLVSVVSPFLSAQNLSSSTFSNELSKQDLYGGAITMHMSDYTDVSNVRVVPDHQEVWTDGDDNTIIIELLNLKEETTTDDAAAFFFNDLAEASEASSAELLHAGLLEHLICPEISSNVEICGAVGRHIVSKFRDEDKSGEKARNHVMVYLINLRLREHGTDMLITMYRTVKVGEKSSTTELKEVDESDDQEFPGLRVFTSMLGTLKIVDKSLFGE